MLIKLFAWLWIIAGIIFLIWPQVLKNRLLKKGLKSKCVRLYYNWCNNIITSLNLIPEGDRKANKQSIRHLIKSWQFLKKA